MAITKEFNQNLINEFRANDGAVTGIFAGSPVVLLTTTGARSGQKRTTPLLYTTDGDNLVIFASKGGAPTNPAWYHNLLANPVVTVELPGKTFQARARVTEGAERERLFSAQSPMRPSALPAAQKTTRQIPVIVLERLD